MPWHYVVYELDENEEPANALSEPMSALDAQELVDALVNEREDYAIVGSFVEE